jgi:hypothetical protein
MLGQLLLEQLRFEASITSNHVSQAPFSLIKLGRTPIRAFGIVENSQWQDVHPDDPEPGAAQRGRHWGRSQTAVQRGTTLSAQVSL